MSKTNIAIDLAMFVVTVAFAALQGWGAKDLIWGLWIASLTLGYSFILASSLSMFIRDDAPDTESSGSTKALSNRLGTSQPLVFNLIIVLFTVFAAGFGSSITWLVLLLSVILVALSLLLKDDKAGLPQRILWRFVTYAPMVVFFLVFFSIHFGGFHFVHGLFLSHFFPLIPQSPFDNNIEGFFASMGDVLLTALWTYWPFIVFSAVARGDDYLKAFRSPGGPNMMMPYANVIRMHLMIFVFAGLYFLGLQTYAVYPILVFYFFPIKELFQLFGVRKKVG